VHSRKEGGFKPTDEEAICGQLSKAVDSVLKKCEDAPGYIKKGHNPVHGDIGKQKHERYLAYYGPNDVECLQLDKLVAIESEIFFETGDVGVVYRPSVLVNDPTDMLTEVEAH
jgi:hypothetical protein